LPQREPIRGIFPLFLIEGKFQVVVADNAESAPALESQHERNQPHVPQCVSTVPSSIWLAAVPALFVVSSFPALAQSNPNQIAILKWYTANTSASFAAQTAHGV